MNGLDNINWPRRINFCFRYDVIINRSVMNSSRFTMKQCQQKPKFLHKNLNQSWRINIQMILFCLSKYNLSATKFAYISLIVTALQHNITITARATRSRLVKRNNNNNKQKEKKNIKKCEKGGQFYRWTYSPCYFHFLLFVFRIFFNFFLFFRISYIEVSFIH